MMMKRVVTLLLLLAGCSAPQVTSAKSAAGQNEPERSLNMEQLCKDQAARRYNGVQKIDVTGLSVSGKL
jgi:starvation-inducible outer membrane lipoprotein